MFQAPLAMAVLSQLRDKNTGSHLDEGINASTNTGSDRYAPNWNNLEFLSLNRVFFSIMYDEI